MNFFESFNKDPTFSAFICSHCQDRQWHSSFGIVYTLVQECHDCWLLKASLHSHLEESWIVDTWYELVLILILISLNVVLITQILTVNIVQLRTLQIIFLLPGKSLLLTGQGLLLHQSQV